VAPGGEDDSARRFRGVFCPTITHRSGLCFACFGCVWSTRLWWYLKGRHVVPWVVAQNVSLELWLGIRVKHVAFLKLWLGMASLELWLGMADEHEELLSCGSGWRVLSVWVCVCCGTYGWVHWDCPPQYQSDEFGSLGTLRRLFVLGTPPGVTKCGPLHGFLHVLH